MDERSAYLTIINEINARHIPRRQTYGDANDDLSSLEFFFENCGLKDATYGITKHNGEYYVNIRTLMPGKHALTSITMISGYVNVIAEVLDLDTKEEVESLIDEINPIVHKYLPRWTLKFDDQTGTCDIWPFEE